MWLLLCASLSILSGTSGILHQWEFEEPGFSFPEIHGCSVSQANGVLDGVIKPADGVYLVFPEAEITVPAKLRLRLKTDAQTYGQGEVYWRAASTEEWRMDRFLRFPVHHDNQWHEYEIPLPLSGTIRQFRLCPGWKPGTFALDWVRVESDPFPEGLSVARAQMKPRAIIEDETLRVILETATNQFSITDKRTGRTWWSDPSDGKAQLAFAEARGPGEMYIDLLDWSTRTHYICTVTLPEPGVLRFSLDTVRPEQPFYALNTYPPRIMTGFPQGKLLFCQRSSGVYIDQNDEEYRGKILRVYGNTDTVNMPWIGVIDETTGEGVMALTETPCDASFLLAPDAEGKAWPQVLWDVSMGSFRYPRQFSYRFIPHGGHIALAGLYRGYARQSGKLLSLADKLSDKPGGPFLAGAPMVWGGTDAWRWVREARTEGMLKAVLSNASHGLNDKTSLRRINEMGYITLDYDNFSDIVDGPPGFETDNVEETANHVLPGLGPMRGWDDGTVVRHVRSSACALNALKSYVPNDLATYGFNGRFVDVSLAIDLNEDYHPKHTFDRRQDMAHRREAIGWLRDSKLVLGAEHGNDWGIDLFEYTEGSLGGPWWWLPQGNWNAGKLLRVRDRSDYSPKYLKYSHGYDMRSPLWQLVYHDCAVSTGYWGDGPGFHYAAAPEISDRKDLFTLLYGGVPVLWRDKSDYDWQANRERFLRTYFDTCLLAESVALSAMTSHEFLSTDRAMQRTTFDSGHRVVVNFSDEPREYTEGQGAVVLLAPRGFHVSGPDIKQSRLWMDRQTVTAIEKGDFVRYESPARRVMGAVTLQGSFTAFLERPERWQIATAPAGEYTIDVSRLTGWDAGAQYALLSLDPLGDTIELRGLHPVSAPLVLTPEKDGRFFALVPQENAPELVLYPSDDFIDFKTPVHISSGVKEAVIRYTLDGSEPTTDAPRYESPLLLKQSSVLKARVFLEEAGLGKSVSKAYRVTETLFHSGLLRGGNAPVRVELPWREKEDLRILVTNGGDFCWSDWTDLGEARFVLESGETVWLSELKPLSAVQTYKALGIDKRSESNDPLTMAGRVFERGVGLFSEAEVRYTAPQGSRRFETWAGLDDKADPKGNPHPSLMGSVEIIIQRVLDHAAQ